MNANKQSSGTCKSSRQARPESLKFVGFLRKHCALKCQRLSSLQSFCSGFYQHAWIYVGRYIPTSDLPEMYSNKGLLSMYYLFFFTSYKICQLEVDIFNCFQTNKNVELRDKILDWQHFFMILKLFKRCSENKTPEPSCHKYTVYVL